MTDRFTSQNLQHFCDQFKLDFNSLSKAFHSHYYPIICKIDQLLDAHKKKQSEELTKSLIIGINAAQGAGKTTMSELLKRVLKHSFQRNVLVVSLDDFYLSQQLRSKLAETEHPLFKTRGVPGTHDVHAAIDFFNQITSSNNKSSMKVPRFDKSADNPVDKSQWAELEGKVDIVIFEGWCIGATAIDQNSLVKPINRLEKNQDQACTWRKSWNQKLAQDYQKLFQSIDYLIYLAAPDWPTVIKWRKQQEKRLRLSLNSTDKQESLMSDAQLDEFMLHFERLTKACFTEMPKKADITIELDNNRMPLNPIS